MPALDLELTSKPWLRCVNLHHTSPQRAGELERLLAGLARLFSPVSAEDLETLMQTGHWRKEKPGVLLAFFNGYRDNYDVAFRLLERFHLIGWFFVVTDFVALPPEEQLGFAKSHRFSVEHAVPVDLRIALSWDELREMSGHHIICSHTASHSTALDVNTPSSILEHEILGSARAIQNAIGQPPRAFCWLRGEPYQSCTVAHPYLQKAGYMFLFGSRRIELLPTR